MHPNVALNEIMSYYIREDQHQPGFLIALRRLFTPIENFRCDLEWNNESNNFDNPANFVFALLKNYHRRQTFKNNAQYTVIFYALRRSLMCKIHIFLIFTDCKAF